MREGPSAPIPDGNVLACERAIAEIRAGRPVLLSTGQEDALISALEAWDASLLTFFEQDWPSPVRALASMIQPDDPALPPPEKNLSLSGRLVLTAPRLQQLGWPRSHPGTFQLERGFLQDLHKIAFDVAVPFQAEPQTLEPIDHMALEMLHLALLLPAALVFPLSAEDRAFLSSVAPLHDLLSLTAQDISAYYCARYDGLRLISRAPVPLSGATACEFIVFRGGDGLRDQVAIVIGQPDFSQPVPVRLHSACLTGDLFASLKCDCGDQLRRTVAQMAQNGGGIILYLDHEGRGNGLSSKIRVYGLQACGYDTYNADAILGFGRDRRRFDFAVQMLKKIGVQKIRLLTNNPKKIQAFEGSDIDLTEIQSVLGRKTKQNISYLISKKEKEGHMIDITKLEDYNQQ